MNKAAVRSISFFTGMGMLTVICAAGLFAADISAPDAAATARNLAVEGDSGYIIGPSNLINIKVVGEEGLQQTYRVDEGGFITHPLLGRVKLSGLTVAKAEEAVRTALAGDYIRDPNVIIFVIEHSHFSVLGEVRKPGNYEILGKLSMLEGISIAGGFTPVANEKRVKILRCDISGEKTLIINLKDALDGRNTGEMNIQAGDVIEVEKSFF